MGTTITQTRLVTGNQFIQNHVDGVLTSSWEAQQRLCPASYGGATQVTTSYRTGRGVPDDVHDDETALLSSKTYGEVRARLYREELQHRRSKWDNGHPFSTHKKYVEANYWHHGTESVNGVRYDYSGPIVPLVGSGNKFPGFSSFDSDYYGAAAISRTRPTKSQANLMQALLELRKEGLPAILGFGLLGHGPKPSQFGEEFLNLEFGIRPLADDLAKAAYAVTASERILEQYQRDSDVQVRRSYTFPVMKTTTVNPVVNGQAIGADATPFRPWVSTSGTRINLVSGKLYDVSTVVQKIRFSGAFRYHSLLNLKNVAQIKKAAEKANHLLGLDLSIELMYNLTPWTWLADWNANIGDVVSNISSLSSDGLALRYGYVMRETIAQRTFVLVKTQPTRFGPEGPFALTFISHKKERVRANPFGFALNPSVYTERQWAILGALGLTKAPKTLP